MGCKITEILSNPAKFTYSFEVTPDVAVQDIDNLKLRPLFYSITWHAKLYSFEGLDIAPLKLAEYLKNKNETVLLHLSCDKLTIAYLELLLDHLKSKAICNIFLIRGDGFDASSSDFKSTLALITYIRKRFGNYFCIGVAGHCDKHVTISSLKEKVNGGADFILSQAFFDTDVFKSFSAKCRIAGITVPIIPGIYPYDKHEDIEKFINICKISADTKQLQQIKNKNRFDVIKDLVHQIYTEMDIKHFHIFTLNKLERAVKIVGTIE